MRIAALTTVGISQRAAAVAAASALVGTGAWTMSAEGSSAKSAGEERPLFRFGVIADIQYCDCDDAANFAGTEVRKYRGTLPQTRAAVAHWNALTEPRPSFVLNLGDLIDGQNAGGYGAGLNMAEPQSEVALGRVTAALSECAAPIYHAVGNHELYNFNWRGLIERLQRPAKQGERRSDWHVTGDSSDSDSGDSNNKIIEPISWRPSDVPSGWTFIMLNCYQVSIEQDENSEGYKAAMDLFKQHTPHIYEAISSGKKAIDFFAGCKDESVMRYVPFNGGLGNKQREWLRKELQAAVKRNDRVVLLSHVPLYVGASSPRTVIYDADEVMELIHSEGHGSVVAVIAGHLHRGGYGVDDHGVHHVTLPSPLNFDDCFGHVNVYDDRLELVAASEASGVVSRTLPFPPMVRPYKCVLESVA